MKERWFMKNVCTSLYPSDSFSVLESRGRGREGGRKGDREWLKEEDLEITIKE